MRRRRLAAGRASRLALCLALLLGSACSQPATPPEPAPARAVPSPTASERAVQPIGTSGTTSLAISGPSQQAADDAQQAAVRAARFLLAAGDYAAAAQRWRALLDTPGAPEMAREARFNLALSRALDGRGTDALDILARPPPTPDPREDFVRGLALDAANQHAEGMRSLGSFATANPTMAAAIWLEVARREQAAGRARESADAASRGLETAPSRTLQRHLLEVRSEGLAVLGDTQAAFDAHRQVLALATSTATLGEQLYRLAQVSRDLNQPEAAVQALQTALERFPYANTTPDALRLVDELGAANRIDAYVLGRARYFVGDNRRAVAALTDHLAAEPGGPDVPNARLYRALASLAPGNEAVGLRDLDAIADAADQDADVAAEALVEGAQALERLGQVDQAALRYQRVLDRFPRLDAAATAAFRLGLVRYVRAADDLALQAWDVLLARRDDLDAESASRVLLWRGKALTRLGRAADARDAWQAAASVQPTTYYALRAASLLGQAPPTRSDEQELTDWFSARNLDLSAATTAVSADPALLRAQALAGLGLLSAASSEADELLQRHADHPDRLYVLARRFHDLGIAGGATRLGRAALTAAGPRAVLEAPVALKRVAFPRPFGALTDQTAARYGLDPLFLEASLRQASDFDAAAEDAATGARGLAMMSPVHADEVALALQDSPESRTRAVHAIEHQAWLLTDRLRRFDGRPEVVLAALGSSERLVDGWLVRAGADDADTFLEQIDFPSLRSSVREMLGARLAYGLTYGPTTDPLVPSRVGPEPTAAWIKLERLNGAAPDDAPLSAAPGVGRPDVQAQFARAAAQQRDGDFPSASEAVRALVDDSDASVASAARLRLAQALLGEGRPAEAIEFLQPVPAVGPDSVATFLIGRASAALGRCAEARTAFEAYAAAHPGSLAAHARAAAADCLLRTGHAAEAASILEAVAQTPGLPRLQSLDFRERLARARARAGDVQAAVADYESLLAGARSDGYRAELNYDLGVLAGDPTAAAARFRAAVTLDARGRAARAGLDELVALGDSFAASLEAAETRFEQSRYREALTAYSATLQRGDASAGRAQYGRGVALVRLGQDRAGIAELESIPRLAPGSPEAADGLFRAGRIRESLADLDGAAATYRRVLGLPNPGTRAADAQFRLAFVQFQQGNLGAATTGWRELVGRLSAPDERAQAAYWLGKALHAGGDEDAAREAWTNAQTTDPSGFYGLRAADHLSGRDDPRAHPDLRLTTPSPTADAPDDAGVARAEALLAMGLRREAIYELDDAADRLTGDDLRRLGVWEQQRGLYYPALVLGLRLSNARTLRYPLPSPGVLERVAREVRVDPLLFAALMRQESNMDQSAESPALARGLSQLIPSTAYEAARALGLQGFRSADLFRPGTNITLGAFTFAQRLERYEQQIFPALAAYNASQFNVDGWLLAAGNVDIDTFAEAIPFTETYPYVQRIYENYRQYLDLYGAP